MLCDKSPSDIVIEIILNFEMSSSKPMHETSTEVDPKFICENVIQYANKNVSDVVGEDGGTDNSDYEASQCNGLYVIDKVNDSEEEYQYFW